MLNKSKKNGTNELLFSDYAPTINSVFLIHSANWLHSTRRSKAEFLNARPAEGVVHREIAKFCLCVPRGTEIRGIRTTLAPNKNASGKHERKTLAENTGGKH